MLATASGVLAASGVAPDSRLCCCLSGGVDSVVLLHVLCELQISVGFELVAAHVHHGLSPHADDWLGFCRDLCARRGVPFFPFRVEVRRDDPEGLEAAARRARHEVLARVACDWLVFGHHQDDQAETLLFRLLRGTGVRGAGAMAVFEPPAAGRAGRLRPLLGLRRAHIEAWAGAHRLSWIEDESNADHRFVRNDIRRRILPAIQHGFPAAVPALARAAEHFREASDLLDELAAIDEASCGGAMLDRARLLNLQDSRIANLLRWQVRRRDIATPSRARLAEALRQLREAEPLRPLHLPLGELACCAYRGRVWLEPRVSAPDAAVPWRGEPQLPWAGGRVEFRAVSDGGLSRAVLGRATTLQLVPRPPGMRLRLVAGRPRRSFKNLCQEAGIPVWLRERLPILEIDGVAAWVGGIGAAAEFAGAPGEEGIEPAWLPRA